MESTPQPECWYNEVAYDQEKKVFYNVNKDAWRSGNAVFSAANNTTLPVNATKFFNDVYKNTQAYENLVLQKEGVPQQLVQKYQAEAMQAKQEADKFRAELRKLQDVHRDAMKEYAHLYVDYTNHAAQHAQTREALKEHAACLEKSRQIIQQMQRCVDEAEQKGYTTYSPPAEKQTIHWSLAQFGKAPHASWYSVVNNGEV